MLKRILLIAGGVVLGFLLLMFVLGWILHKPLPQGEEGPEAEALARKVLQAINHPAWDTTYAVSWEYAGRNQFLWDRKRHWVEVKWKDTRVLLKIDEKRGRAWVKGEEVVDPKSRSHLLDKAWKNWANDSFWLNAPAKVFDPGTERRVVISPKGKKGLLVTYTQGGVTPGDSYLWWLDENGLPESWQMWVSILPIGGLEFGWTQWKSLSTGAKIATLRKGSLLDLPITDLKGATSVEALTGGANPFDAL